VNSEKIASRKQEQKGEVESVFQKGMQLYNKGSYAEAAKYFTKSRALAEKNNYAKYIDESENLISMCRTALAERHYRVGHQYFRENRYESAAYEFRKTLEYNTDHADARAEMSRVSEYLAGKYYEEGMSTFTQGDLDKAKELFKKSLFYKPDKAESLRALERIK
jgi:tetratricopeptide (TPR) repeat protein